MGTFCTPWAYRIVSHLPTCEGALPQFVLGVVVIFYGGGALLWLKATLERGKGSKGM